MNTIRQPSLRFWITTALAFPLGWFLGKSMAPKNESASFALTPEKPYTLLPLDDGKAEALRKLLTRSERERSPLDEISFFDQLSERELASVYRKAKREGAYSLLRELEGYWALRDPKRALEFAKWDLEGCDHLAYLSLAELARKEPDQWVKAALNLGHKGLAKDRNRSFWRDDSPEKQIHSARQELEERGLITRTFEDLAKKNPQDAAKQALALKDRRAKSEALRGVAREWAKKAPEAALAWAKDITPNVSRLETMRSVLAEWGAKDPAACAKHLGELPKSLATIPVVEDVVKAWSVANPEEAMNWIGQEATGVMREKALSALIDSANDPAAAARLLAEQRYASTEPEVVAKAAARWGQDDPASALEWALNLPQEEGREEATNAALQGWAERSPADASQYLAKLQAEGLIADADKAKLAIATGMGEVDPEGSLELLQQLPLEDRGQRKVASDTLATLSDTDPREASEWLEQLAGSLDKGTAGWWTTNGVVSKWVQSDPEAVEDWLGKLPVSQLKDWAIQSLAFHLMATDREAAFKWASKPSNPQIRRDIVANLLADLPRHTGVADLLANSPFSEAEKQSFQDLVQSSGHGKTSGW